MGVQEYAGAGSLAVAAELGAALAATPDLTDLLRTLQRQLKWLECDQNLWRGGDG